MDILGKQGGIRGPSWEYKVRRICQNKKTGDIFGITTPRTIFEQFSGCTMGLSVSGNSIIYTIQKGERKVKSGCDLFEAII